MSSFAEPMIESLLVLLDDLKRRYKIPAANFLGHGDVIPGRKVDPSRLFPWQRLAERGFGVWCNPPYAPATSRDDALLLAARESFADFFNCRPDEVSFGNNMSTITFHISRAVGRGLNPGDERGQHAVRDVT